MIRTRPPARRATTQEGDSRTATLIWGGIILGVLALFALLYLALRGPGELAGIQRFAGLSALHDENPVYENTGLPPVGGPHAPPPGWQNCGIYEEPIEPKNAVHSLEHGAVWITYQPELPAADVARLQDRVRGEPYVLLSPYPGLASPVVLTAWGLQLRLDDADDGRIPQFIARYQRGPQAPEPGGLCVDGVGTPVQ